jgi:hypothetical protein
MELPSRNIPSQNDESQHSEYEKAPSVEKAPDFELKSPDPIIMLPNSALTKKIIAFNLSEEARKDKLKMCLVCQTKRDYIIPKKKRKVNEPESKFRYAVHLCDYCAMLKYFEWNQYFKETLAKFGCYETVIENQVKVPCHEKGAFIGQSFRMVYLSKDTGYIDPTTAETIPLSCSITLLKKQLDSNNLVPECVLHRTWSNPGFPFKFKGKVNESLQQLVRDIKLEAGGCENVEHCSFNGSIFEGLLEKDEEKALAVLSLVDKIGPNIYFIRPETDRDLVLLSDSEQVKKRIKDEMACYCLNCLAQFKYEQIEEKRKTMEKEFPVNSAKVRSFWKKLRSSNVEVYEMEYYKIISKEVKKMLDRY